MIDRGAVWKRKHIDTLCPFALDPVGVDEFLRERRSGDDAGDGDVDVGLQQRGRKVTAPLMGLEEETPLCHVPERHAVLIERRLATREEHREDPEP